jgi:hypothetical protein
LPKSRHQNVIRAFQIAGASLVLLDVLLYYGMYRSTQALASSTDQQFASLRRRIFDGETRIERLKKFLGALPEEGKRLSSFEKDHTTPRRQAYSQAAKLLRLEAEKSGAQLAKLGFNLDTKPSGPLLRLGSVIVVDGSFPALLKFAHGLETASDLILIRSFNIAAVEDRTLELRLAADFYLTP